MAKFEKHIFICTNQRPEGHPRGCCNQSGEADLHRAFKAKLAERGIPGDRVRANKSGCLEQCEVGPTVVVYPDAVWYGGVTPADRRAHFAAGLPTQNRWFLPRMNSRPSATAGVAVTGSPTESVASSRNVGSAAKTYTLPSSPQT